MDVEQHIADLEHDLDKAIEQLQQNQRQLEDKDTKIDILENRIKQMRIDVGGRSGKSCIERERERENRRVAGREGRCLHSTADDPGESESGVLSSEVGAERGKAKAASGIAESGEGSF